MWMRAAVRTMAAGLLALLLLAAWLIPPNWSEAAYIAAALSCLLAAWRWSRRWALLALATTALAMAARVVAVHGDATVQMRRLPADTPPLLLDALVPEAVGTVLAAAALGAVDKFERDPEPDLAAILRDSYGRMRSGGPISTPAVGTYLGMQSPEAFDTLILGAQPPIDSAVIFLHGFAGNFNVYCQHFAQAIGDGARVYCPSVGPKGDWWSADGERTARATIAHARAQGAERIWLAGLSNGAAGAGTLAPRLRDELSGVVLISGTPRRGAPPKGLDVLVIHGDRDPMSSAARARRYAQQAGDRGAHVTLPGGHFVFLSQHERAQAALREWFAPRLSSPR